MEYDKMMNSRNSEPFSKGITKNIDCVINIIKFYLYELKINE